MHTSCKVLLYCFHLFHLCQKSPTVSPPWIDVTLVAFLQCRTLISQNAAFPLHFRFFPCVFCITMMGKWFNRYFYNILSISGPFWQGRLRRPAAPLRSALAKNIPWTSTQYIIFGFCTYLQSVVELNNLKSKMAGLFCIHINGTSNIETTKYF